MSWFSLLPAGYTALETWAIRIFLILATLTIGPWAIFVLYDVLLYIWRSATYELPAIGGRARGKQRPRKLSLAELPGPREVVGEVVKGVSSDAAEVVEKQRVKTKGRRGGKAAGGRS